MISLKYSESLSTIQKKRRIICGVAVNDADYSTLLGYTEDGKQVRCPFYTKWKTMIARCYNEKVYSLPENQRYKDCTVAQEWLSFMNFRSWMASQDWEGKQIDKDILYPGNKIYGPDTCLLVPQHINSLIIDQDEGKYGKGVRLNSSGSFTYVKRNGSGKKREWITVKTKGEAIEGYRKYKLLEIITEAKKLDDEKVKTALINYAKHKYAPAQTTVLGFPYGED